MHSQVLNGPIDIALPFIADYLGPIMFRKRPSSHMKTALSMHSSRRCQRVCCAWRSACCPILLVALLTRMARPVAQTTRAASQGDTAALFACVNFRYHACLLQSHGPQMVGEASKTAGSPVLSRPPALYPTEPRR